jgi:hypothetical protein
VLKSLFVSLAQTRVFVDISGKLKDAVEENSDMVDYSNWFRPVNGLSRDLFSWVFMFLGFHLVLPDLLQLLKACLDGVEQTEISHDSAKVATADDRESRGAHSHTEYLLDLGPGSLNHGEELLVDILLHVENDFSLSLNDGSSWGSGLLSRGLMLIGEVIVGLLGGRVLEAPC